MGTPLGSPVLPEEQISDGSRIDFDVEGKTRALRHLSGGNKPVLWESGTEIGRVVHIRQDHR